MTNDESGASPKTLSDLLAVMAALRTPGTGCPWDLAQTFRTIAPYTIEEAYEVADAIERDDRADLRHELGDLLLQVVYHARLAEEEGAFAFADVVDAITTKMLRRHPHVFGTAEEREAGAAEGFWERIKAEEKAEKSVRRALRDSPLPRGEGLGVGGGPIPSVLESPPPVLPHKGGGTPNLSGPRKETVAPSLLDDIPVTLPALTRAVKLQDEAAKVGFDWPSLAPVFEKMREELSELEEACARASAVGSSGSGIEARSKIEEEFGDLLFVVTNVARHLKIDPEGALRAANQKFIRRFHCIEVALAAAGRTPEQSSLAEMDRLWDEAKARERGGG